MNQSLARLHSPHLPSWSPENEPRGKYGCHWYNKKWGFHSHRGSPIAVWLIMENPIKMDHLGVSPFQETSNGSWNWPSQDYLHFSAIPIKWFLVGLNTWLVLRTWCFKFSACWIKYDKITFISFQKIVSCLLLIMPPSLFTIAHTPVLLIKRQPFPIFAHSDCPKSLFCFHYIPICRIFCWWTPSVWCLNPHSWWLNPQNHIQLQLFNHHSWLLSG